MREVEGENKGVVEVEEAANKGGDEGEEEEEREREAIEMGPFAPLNFFFFFWSCSLFLSFFCSYSSSLSRSCFVLYLFFPSVVE